MQSEPVHAESSGTLSTSKLSSLGPTPLLVLLLPPCVLLFALDVMIKSSSKRIMESSSSSSTAKPVHTRPKGENIENTKAAVLRQVSMDLDTLEEQMMQDDLRRKEARLMEKRRKFAHHRQRLATLEHQRCQSLVNRPTIPITEPQTDLDDKPHIRRKGLRTQVDPAFIAFCERLLLENRLWRQQRELKAVQASLTSMTKAKDSSAFQAFCDRLILTNNVWRLQKEVDRLNLEIEKVRRSRVIAVTRAAKQMVFDVQKERMIEEYVKELLAELAECRQSVKDIREQQQREVEEMADVFRKEYRRMSRELERLKLAQEAKALEQELSNDIETRMLARYERQEENFFAAVDVDSAATEEDAGSDTELEIMSNMSSSTCVGSAGVLSPNRKSSFGGDIQPAKQLYLRRKSSLTPLKLDRDVASPQSSLAQKQEGKSYTGFSFNPLFFGQAIASRDATPSPIRSTTKDNLLKPTGSTTDPTRGATKIASIRPQWRF